MTRERQIRVVQWTTGNVGKVSVKAVIANAGLELVGCYAWSPDKIGRDVGELAGTDPVGVVATDDVDALLALKPDVVVYNPMWPDVDEMVRILSSGVNIATTAAFVTGHSLGADARRRVADACVAGGSSIIGTGANPGFIEAYALMTAGICNRVDKITIIESGDSTLYDSPATEAPAGFGQPLDHPGLQEMTRKATGVFEDGLRMMAHGLDIELDEVRCHTEYSRTTQALDLPGDWRIEAGTVAGMVISWTGHVSGREVIEIRMRWKKGEFLDPPIEIGDTYQIQVDGLPSVSVTLQPFPPADFQGGSFADFLVLGMAMTAMPAINAIPIVVDAAPGIVTYADLGFPFPRNLVSA